MFYQNFNFIKNETPTQVFPVNFGKFLNNNFFTEYLQWLFLQMLDECVACVQS